MSGPNFFEQALNLAKSAGIDTSEVIDKISSQIPGGDTVAQVLKTGLNMATSQGSGENEDQGENEVQDESENSEQEA
jgi:hypothetical protein